MLGTKVTFAEQPPPVFYNVKQITPRTRTLTKAQRALNPRRGVVLYIDSEPRPVPREKRASRRQTTATQDRLRQSPLATSWYQLHKMALPTINAQYQKRTEGEIDKLKAVEIALLAKIAEGVNKETALTQPVDQASPEAVLRAEEQKIELQQVKADMAEQQEQLRNVTLELDRKNAVIRDIQADEIKDRQREIDVRQQQAASRFEQDLALSRASVENLRQNQQAMQAANERQLQQTIIGFESVEDRLDEMKAQMAEMQRAGRVSVGIERPEELSVREKVERFEEKASRAETGKREGEDESTLERRMRFQKMSMKQLREALRTQANIMNGLWAMGGKRTSKADLVDMAMLNL